MPPIADKSRGRWPLVAILADAVLTVFLVVFWWWIVTSILSAWRATPPAERSARVLGALTAVAVAATVGALLWWLNRASPLRRTPPTFLDPSYTRRPGGAGPSARVVDGPRMPPVAGGRHLLEAPAGILFALRIPAGVTREEFARRLGVRHSAACACGGRLDSACWWEVLPEIERQNGPAVTLAAGFERHVPHAVGKLS